MVKRIKSGEFHGLRLPTRAERCDQYDVSSS